MNHLMLFGNMVRKNLFKNWPKAIKLIDWKSLAAHEIKDI